MIQYKVDAINERGDALSNRQVQVVDNAGAIVDIFKDKAGTRFTDATNTVVNYALTELGTATFYFEPASGMTLQTYDSAGNLTSAEPDFADKFVIDNLPGNISQDAVTDLTDDLAAINSDIAGKADASATTAVLATKTNTADLASTDSGKGASIVAVQDGDGGAKFATMQAAVDYLKTNEGMNFLGAVDRNGGDTFTTAQGAVDFITQTPQNCHRHRIAGVLDLGFSHYDYLKNQYGYSYLYPQSFAIDEIDNELWVVYYPSGGANTWTWVVVRDLTTFAEKRVFSAGGSPHPENIALSREGGSRYLRVLAAQYTVGKYDVTVLPNDLDRLTAVSLHEIRARNGLIERNGDFYVEAAYWGTGSFKHYFTIYDKTLSTRKGAIDLNVFTQGDVGSGSLADAGFMNKRQGIAVGDGFFACAFGGDYEKNPADVNRRSDIGVKLVNQGGQIIKQSMMRADLFAAKLESLGYTVDRTEIEGAWVTSDNRIFSLIVTKSSTISGIENSVFLVEFFSDDPRAVDFSDCTAPKVPVLDGNYWRPMRYAEQDLINPITGAKITSLAQVCDFLGRMNLGGMEFYTSNFPDILGPFNEVLPSARMVKVKNRNNFTYDVYVMRSEFTASFTYVDGVWSAASGPGPNSLGSLTWLALGDSITAAAGSYAGRIATSYRGGRLTNAGVSSSRMAETGVLNSDAFCNKTSGSFTAGYDLITVAFGTNDASGSVPIGTLGSTNKSTFYGAMEVGYANIVAANPTARVIFLLPTYRTSGGGDGIVTAYRNAIKDFCSSKGLACIPCNEEMGINAQTASALLSDGLHPNSAGQVLMAKYVGAKLSALV